MQKNQKIKRPRDPIVLAKLIGDIAIGITEDKVEDKKEILQIGRLDSSRDWSHAKDMVKGMWLILQQNIPKDYILSTNEYHCVREFVEKAFNLRGFSIKWKGTGLNEIGYDEHTGRELIFVSEKYFRPAEVDELLGDSTLARTELGWNPEITFDELVTDMVESDTTVL